MIPTLLGITIITFTIIRMAPGDPTSESQIGEAGGVGIDPTKSGKDVRKAKRALLGMAASYSYSAITTDPDGDKIKHIFDWGDGSTTETDFVASGTKVTEKHSWEPAGTYQVRVMSIDEKGAASAWSHPLTVTITGREGVSIMRSQPDKTASTVEGNKSPLTPIAPDGTAFGSVDVPLYVQYWNWLKRIVTLDFGMYIKSHKPVADELKSRLTITMTLSIIAIFISYIVAVPIGVFSSTGRYPFFDKIITVILFILYSLPSFWIATILMIYFSTPGRAIELPIIGLHSEGAENLPFFEWLIDYSQHLILPVICLTYAGLAGLSRYSRSGMMEVVRQDFIRTARAKGLSERVVIFKHALRNGMIPIITLMASILPAMIGGAVIIESIFTIEGMGKMAFDAILNREYNAIMAISVMSAILTLLGILLSDILYVIVDPRISFEKISR
ncbi:MAG: hypothetical protein A2W23_01470 [Planctomycetes bacterium RBG_16_43_13]|nr:MAG: hypothetical protein A2W23_01470 [Planctomycetes bacterium RBG_16_43_13]